jgi:transcriptional regulator with XRE-family HTH domain
VSEQSRGEWIAEELAARDLMFSELARSIGVAISTVSRWCRGEWEPSDDNFERAKKALSKVCPALLLPPNYGCIEDIPECEQCEYAKQCKRRVLADYPCMCEALDRMELDRAAHVGVLQELVWWREISEEDTVDSLLSP